MRKRHRFSLYKRYPPSPACSCQICRDYCKRPGWWTVAEAEKALLAGYAEQMMLEVAPEFTFGVLAPAFKGCEQSFALQEYAWAGCTFLIDGLCELHATDLMPLECRFCHHERPGQGPECHADLGKDWNTPAGRQLVHQWCNLSGLNNKYGK